MTYTVIVAEDERTSAHKSCPENPESGSGFSGGRNCTNRRSGSGSGRKAQPLIL